MLRKSFGHFLILFLLCGLVLTACGDAPAVTPGSGAIVPPIATTAASTTVAATSNTAATTSAPVATTAAPATSAAVATTAVPAAPTTAAPATTVAPTTAVPATTKAPVAVGKGKLVFANSKNEIFTISPDGKEQKKVGTGFSPVWSPDGEKIAYSAVTKEKAPGLTSEMVIRTMNADGTGVQDVCKGKENYLIYPERWSPSGRFIVFGSLRAQTDSFPVMTLCNPKDGTLTEIKRPTSEPYSFYDWTPDGNYTIWEEIAGQNYNVSYGDPDLAGKDATLITTDKYPQVNGIIPPFFSGGRISPDGKTIALTTETDIRFFSVPGQKSPFEGKKVELSAKIQPRQPSFSPDGKALAVICYLGVENKFVLRIVNLDGETFGKIGPLTASDVLAVRADWSRV